MSIKKQLLFYLTSALLTFSAINANADEMLFGYCNSTDNPTGTLTDNTEDAWSSAAIYIPASTATTIQGCQIKGIRFGINLMLNVDASKAWIRTELGGNNLAEKAIDKESEPKLARGWNEVVFEEPWTVPADCQGFYIGYSVHQKGYAYALASNDTPSTNGLFVSLADGEWQNLSEEGTLYIDALVEGAALPAVNLGIVSSVCDGVCYSGNNVKASMRVYNMGAKTAESFTVNLLAGGEKVASCEVQTAVKPGENVLVPLTFTPDFKHAGDYTVSLQIAEINGGKDADLADNVSSEMQMRVLGGTVQRMVLIEEFTTENCPNCPYGAELLHNLMVREDTQGRIAAVCHHSGYTYDHLTMDCDKAYEWFYNADAVYAPAFMIDRYSDNNVTPVQNKSYLDYYYDIRKDVPPSVALTVSGELSVDKQSLTVTVKGVKIENQQMCSDPYITLWLTENNVQARNQKGATGSFKHQHLTRKVNSTWGAPVTFNGNDFEYTYTFENLDPTWKLADMEVIGAVHNVKGSRQTDMEVENACLFKCSTMSQDTSSIDIENVDDVQATPLYFTLSGMKVNPSQLAPGMYIRVCGQKVQKIIVK
ncbi:MAG: hypothetical protein NC402_02310 [Prevotella sp.]|nr:hypothetical protein [Prevotella sp.]MCM1074634.1 hypothetical protein [Ruminococcus sp.]